MGTCRYNNPQSLVCTQPFEWLEIQESGVLFLCCPAWLKRPIGVLGDHPLEQIWNGPVAREIRQTVLNGSFHGCNPRRCPRLSAGRPPVQPLSLLPEGPVRDAIAAGIVRLPYGPRKVNVCFDGRCNLSCPSCRRRPYRPTDTEIAKMAELTEWVEAEVAPSAVHLSLSGHGDPFAGPLYRRLLQRVGPQRWPRLEGIRLHTNGLEWTPRTWEELNGVHPYVATAEISVDAGCEATYRANRGGDWNRLLSNLAFVAGLGKDVTLSYVVQANNFREIPQCVHLGREFGFRTYFSQLVNWGTFGRDEFARRAVHRPEHPDHQALLDLLRPWQGLPDVDLGNLAPLADR